MCLAFPAKVVELKQKGRIAIVDAPNGKIEVNNMAENAKVGDYVLVQQGFIVETLSEEDAKEVLGSK